MSFELEWIRALKDFKTSVRGTPAHSMSNVIDRLNEVAAEYEDEGLDAEATLTYDTIHLLEIQLELKGD